MMIMMFVLGMVTWQIVTTVVYYVSSRDTEKCAICGSGICALIEVGASAIIHKIRLRKSRKVKKDIDN